MYSSLMSMTNSLIPKQNALAQEIVHELVYRSLLYRNTTKACLELGVLPQTGMRYVKEEKTFGTVLTDEERDHLTFVLQAAKQENIQRSEAQWEGIRHVLLEKVAKVVMQEDFDPLDKDHAAAIRNVMFAAKLASEQERVIKGEDIATVKHEHQHTGTIDHKHQMVQIPVFTDEQYDRLIDDLSKDQEMIEIKSKQSKEIE